MTNEHKKKQQLDALINIFSDLNLGSRIEDHLWDAFVDESELPLQEEKFQTQYQALKQAAANWMKR